MEQQFSGMHDCTIQECFECYLNFPETDTPEENPLNYAYIREQQQEDNKLLALLEKYPDNYYYDRLEMMSMTLTLFATIKIITTSPTLALWRFHVIT